MYLKTLLSRLRSAYGHRRRSRLTENPLVQLASCEQLEDKTLLSSVRLDPPAVGGYGRIDSDTVTPDEKFVVFEDRSSADGPSTLYSTPITGGPVAQLSHSNHDGGSIGYFAASADSQWVVYLADLDVENQLELYSVPVQGGSPTKLNLPLKTNADVKHFVISEDSQWVVYSAIYSTEIYSVPISGGPTTKLNSSLVSGGNVSNFAISEDSSYVVYQADQEMDETQELYSVPITGGEVTKLNTTLSANDNVVRYKIDPESNRVVYTTGEGRSQISANQLLSVPITGGNPIELIVPLSSDGQISISSITNGKLLYTAAESADAIEYLYSVSILGSPSTRLSIDLLPGEHIAGFSQTGNRETVVYRVSEGSSLSAIYSVDSTGGPSTLLNEPMDDGVRLSWSVISPDGNHAMYFTQDSTGLRELYLVPVTGGEVTRLSNPTTGWYPYNARFSGDSNRIIMMGRDYVGTNSQLYTIPTTGGEFRQLSEPGIPGGRLTGLQWRRPIGNFSVFWGNFDSINDVGIYSASINPAVELSVSSSSGTEADATIITVTATTDFAVAGVQTIDVEVSGVGVTREDYSLTNTSITIPDGATSGRIQFIVRNDGATEPVENAVLNLTNPSPGLGVIVGSSQAITIFSDDLAPTNDVFTASSTGAYGPFAVQHEDDERQRIPEWESRFGNAYELRSAASDRHHVTDVFVPVAPDLAYGISGWAKSGDEFGLRFDPDNQQSFGIEAYDADYQSLGIFPVALEKSAVPGDFTYRQYTAVVGFGPGYYAELPTSTSFIRPYVDVNQHASTDNFITWRDIVVRELPAGSTNEAMDLPLIDLSVDTPESDVAELNSIALDDVYRFAPTDERIVVDTNQDYGLAVNMFELEDEFHHFLGVRSYDSDDLLIHSVHVTRFENATDTRLAKAVSPGDTSIFVTDATGWSNEFGASAETRSLAWYGYSNSSGDVYDDYSYTRNVAFDFDNGMWDSGGIAFDAAENAWRIDLVNPWAGPTINAGVAIRNASGSDSVQTFTTPTDGFYSNPPDGQRDERDWITLRSEIGSGTWQNGQPDESTFRPGTDSVQPVLRQWIGDAEILFGVSRDLDAVLADSQASFDGFHRVVLDESLQTAVADQQTPVDTASSYIIKAEAASGLVLNDDPAPSEQHSLGYYAFDSDGLAIESQHVTRFWSAADTTLAADLNPGDTTLELTDGHGWSNGGLPETRALAWYGYQSSGGQLFDDFTYTRNVAFDQINGLWDAGSIDGNTITLRSPWAGPSLPSGSSVRNAAGGDSLIAALAEDQSVPNAWQNYSKVVGGEWQNGVRSHSSFPPGTSAIQLAVQANTAEFSDDAVLQVRDFSSTMLSGPPVSATAEHKAVIDLDVLTNDQADTSSIRIVSVSDGAFGTAVVVPGGAANEQDIVRYTSAAWFIGTDVVTYVARDSDSGEEWTATASVTIVGSNLTSDAAAANVIASQGQDATANTRVPNPTRSATLSQVRLHDVETGQLLRADSMPVESLDYLAEDGDDNTLAFAIKSGVSDGVLNFKFDGTFEYTSNDGFVGSDGFDYVVSDGLHKTHFRANIEVAASDDELLEQRMGELIVGLHNFHDVYDRFPYDDRQTDHYDANGVPHLSWRVHLLPYLGYTSLYAQFRFDEPWDSPHNLPLASQMPSQFRSPGDSVDTSTTRFQIVSDFDDLSGKYLIGQDSNGNQGMGRIRDIIDGLGNTVMFVQSGADVAVPWTAPVDIDFDPANPFAALGTIPNGQLQLMIADGSIISLDISTISGSEFDSLITKYGGEPVDADTIEERDIQHTTGPRLHNPELSYRNSNQFRVLSLAFHNFHDVFSRFPNSNASDHFDADGRPHHSWRVHLLPFLGHRNIYQQFRLDEPWDSDHNLPLISLMPDIYRSEADAWNSTTTRIQTFTGPDAPFPDPNAAGDYFSPRFRDFTDETSGTIMFTEVGADRSVPWTAPQDIEFDINNPLAGLGDLSNGTIRLGMADGSYREIGVDIDPQNFAALVTHQGQEIDQEDSGENRELQRFTNVDSQILNTRNTLKQLGLGLHNYHDVFNRLPIGITSPRSFDDEGRPFLSWRVHLLPFLEEGNLYNQFNLEEPWDSPTNLPLLDKMPDIFRSIGDPFDSTTTKFQVLRGVHGSFLGPSSSYDERGPQFRDFRDGTSNTILVVEAGDSVAVPWTQHRDIEFDPTDVLGSLGLPADALLHAVMADGSARNFRLNYSDAWISAWMSRDGGEIPHEQVGSTTPGFLVNKSDLIIAEGDLGALEVTLTKPGNVQFDVSLSRDGVVVADKTTLTFTTADWNMPQAVTLEAINDLLPDNGEALTVSIAVNASNSDDEFDLLASQSVLVTTVDDDVPGLSVTRTGLDTTVTENGPTDTFDVGLLAEPASSVVVTVEVLDVNNATVDLTKLTFTPSNWNLLQAVTVTATDDSLVEGDQTTSIVVTVDPASSDDAFDNLPPENLSVTIVDDDEGDFVVSHSSGSTSVSESGSEDWMDVVLTGQPFGNVVVQATSPNSAEVLVTTSQVTFTPDNWNVPQRIIVQGVDDFAPDGDQSTNITVSINDANSDPSFALAPSQSVLVTTSDDEPGRLDIDGNGRPNATTDGILAIRHLFGFTGQVLISDAVGTDATNTTAAQVVSALLAAPEMLDVDGNGTQDATTDGILIIRYLLGFIDNALISSAIGSGAIRTTGPEVSRFLDGFMPRSGGSSDSGSGTGSGSGSAASDSGDSDRSFGSATTPLTPASAKSPSRQLFNTTDEWLRLYPSDALANKSSVPADGNSPAANSDRRKTEPSAGDSWKSLVGLENGQATANVLLLSLAEPADPGPLNAFNDLLTVELKAASDEHQQTSKRDQPTKHDPPLNAPDVDQVMTDWATSSDNFPGQTDLSI